MSDQYRNLARNLHAAYLANRMGIGLGYALKTYVPTDPGEYWLSLAEIVEKQVDQDIQKKLKDVSIAGGVSQPDKLATRANGEPGSVEGSVPE